MERFYGGSLEPLGERQVGVIAGTSQLARDGHIVDMEGMDLSNYRKNPVVHWQHDPFMVVGISPALDVIGHVLYSLVEFAPAGVSPVADQVCSLVKAGVIRACSIGFEPRESKPLDPSRPRGGQHITKSELLEISFVGVPADPGALVVARSMSQTRAPEFFAGLAPVPRAAIERAAARLPRARNAAGLMTPAAHTWLLVEQRRREREHEFSYEARQRDLAQLREAGRRLLD